MPKNIPPKQLRPKQEQEHQPGSQQRMTPAPHASGEGYRPADKLRGRVALITGGDSGIGRAVAVAFAKEGADIVITYLAEESDDATETQKLIEAAGVRCLSIPGDIGLESTAKTLIKRTIETFAQLDIVVHNAGEQHPQKDPQAISAEQVERTFNTNIIAAFHLLRHALPHLQRGASFITTSSVVAYRGSAELVDYGATKAALVGMTRSLALALAERGIRVNTVAPGPIWTPLIAATFPADKVSTFGSTVPMKRAGEPDEVAPAFVYLASEDGRYVSGQCIHVNGGEPVNG